MWRSITSKFLIATVIAVVANVAMVDDAVAVTYAAPGYYSVSGFTTGCLRVRSQPNTSSSSSVCLSLGTSVYLSCAVTGDFS